MPQPSGDARVKWLPTRQLPLGTRIASSSINNLEEGMQRSDDTRRYGGASTRDPERVLTKALTDELRRRLLEARAALLRTVTLTDEELAALDRPQPSDPPEHAASASAASLLARLGGREKRELDDIADALRRLVRGVYGTCESCRKPIPLERLLALPAVRFCLGCQASTEESS
jgi:DnaK suppressor protein